MIGFLVGTACLIGLVKVVRAGRYGGACAGGGCGGGRSWGGGHGWHGHHGHGDHGGHGGWREGFRGGASNFWLRGLFERLDTTPGQEKVIKQAAEEIFEATRSARGEMEQSKKDIANALRGGVVDETAMGELFARHDDKLREVRKAFVGAFAKVSEALDEEQRKRLADMLERGGGFGGRMGGGPYRGRSGGGEWA